MDNIFADIQMSEIFYSLELERDKYITIFLHTEEKKRKCLKIPTMAFKQI